MGSRPADAVGGGARGRLRPAAGGPDGLGADPLPLSRPAAAERAGASADGAAAGGHRLAAADRVRHPRADRRDAGSLVRHPAGVHHRGRQPGLRRDDLPDHGARRSACRWTRSMPGWSRRPARWAPAGSTGCSTSPCRWPRPASWSAASSPTRPASASSARSSPSPPTSPARPRPCRWRSTPRCRCRAARRRRPNCRWCR